jgi:hypothetical protein
MSDSSESHPWNILGSDGSMEIELELEYMSDTQKISLEDKQKLTCYESLNKAH